MLQEMPLSNSQAFKRVPEMLDTTQDPKTGTFTHSYCLYSLWHRFRLLPGMVWKTEQLTHHICKSIWTTLGKEKLCRREPNHAMVPWALHSLSILFISTDLVPWIPDRSRGPEQSTSHLLCSPAALHSAVSGTIHHLLPRRVTGTSSQAWGISVHLRSILHSENSFPIFTTANEAD